jgi:hypothetical protein
MFATVLLALLAPSEPVRSTSATLWIVDDGGGPGVDFTQPQAAVDAASDGDAILIRPGVYGSMAIDGKGLVVCGDPAGTALLSDAQIEVRNLAAGQTVLLQHLEVHGVLTFPLFIGEGLPAFHAAGNAGPLRVEDCRFLPSDLLSLTSGLPGGGGALVEGSSAVSFARCVLQGGLAASEPSGGGAPGLRAAGSALALHDCQVRGASIPGTDCGPFGGCGITEPAGTGAVLEDSLVFASGCAFAGGDGGDGADCYPFGMDGAGPDGGDGVLLATGGAVLRALACTFTAGSGGASACDPGADGAPVASDGGTFVPLTGIARSLRVTSPVEGGTPARVEIDAGPGELVFGLASPGAGYLPLDVFDGVLLCQPTALVIPLGTAPATGELSFPVGTPPPPPGIGAVVHYLQVAVLTTGGAIKLGSGAALVILE